MSRILDQKNFKYVPAAKTDVAKTFKRERARLKAEAERNRVEEQQLAARLSPLKRDRKCA
jgi:hypothetical protein